MNQILGDLPPELSPPAPDTPAARILAATRSILAAEGVGAVSTRRIAREAAVNQAMINYYFGTKDELLDAVVSQEILEIIRDVFGRLAGEAAGSSEFFVQFPLRLIDVLQPDATRRQLLRLVLATEPQRLRRVIAALGDHGVLGTSGLLRDLVVRAQARGELPAMSPRSVLLFLIANAYGIVLMEPLAREVTGFALDDDDHWREHRANLETLLRRAIAAPERTDR